METLLEMAARNAQKTRLQALFALTGSLATPLIYTDIGALWGVDNDLVKRLNGLKRLKIVGFEPDEAECARLRQDSPDNIYLPIGVGDEDHSRQFFITAFNANSSFLEPDLAAFHGLPHANTFRVVRRVEVPMRRLDTLIAEGAMPQPDFLKIDAQGFELNVLRGCGTNIQAIVGIRLETQLRPLYKNQATFFQIYAFLRDQGFILRDIRLTHPIGYEVVEIEVFFSQTAPRIQRQNIIRIWELLHDIPPGRNVEVRDGRISFSMLL